MTGGDLCACGPCIRACSRGLCSSCALASPTACVCRCWRWRGRLPSSRSGSKRPGNCPLGFRVVAVSEPRLPLASVVLRFSCCAWAWCGPQFCLNPRAGEPRQRDCNECYAFFGSIHTWPPPGRPVFLLDCYPDFGDDDAHSRTPFPERELAARAAGGRAKGLRPVGGVTAWAVDVWHLECQHRTPTGAGCRESLLSDCHCVFDLGNGCHSFASFRGWVAGETRHTPPISDYINKIPHLSTKKITASTGKSTAFPQLFHRGWHNSCRVIAE